MKELIESISKKHIESGITLNLPVSDSEIKTFEKDFGFPLPMDFKEFYLICNGFYCEEDVFNITQLSDIRQFPDHYGSNWFYFSEYMTYSDMWGLRFVSSGHYEIFNASCPEKIMTSSLVDFLKRFLTGNVFDIGGLYEWHEELGIIR